MQIVIKILILNLKHLKKLTVRFCDQTILKVIRNKNLHELLIGTYFCMEDYDNSLKILSQKLQTLSLTTDVSSKIINNILLHFPKLRFLAVNFSNESSFYTEIPPNFDHLNLKELHVRNAEEHHRILENVVMCTALETFKIDMEVNVQSLRRFLQKQPNVKFLNIKVFYSSGFIANLGTCFKSLVELKVQSRFYSLVNLREKLGEIFPESQLMTAEGDDWILVLKNKRLSIT